MIAVLFYYEGVFAHLLLPEPELDDCQHIRRVAHGLAVVGRFEGLSFVEDIQILLNALSIDGASLATAHWRKEHLIVTLFGTECGPASNSGQHLAFMFSDGLQEVGIGDCHWISCLGFDLTRLIKLKA